MFYIFVITSSNVFFAFDIDKTLLIYAQKNTFIKFLLSIIKIHF